MRTTTLLLLCALAAAPAFGDSIPNPVLNFSLTAIESNFLYSGSTIYLSSNGSSDGLPRYGDFDLTVWNTDGSSSDFNNGRITAAIYNSPNATLLSGEVSGASFNAHTDLLTGSFSGIEEIRLCEPGCGQWIFYTVSGIFSETVNLNQPLGTGTIDITGAKFGGPFVAPEPGSLAMMGTGLCGIVSLVQRKLRRARLPFWEIQR